MLHAQTAICHPLFFISISISFSGIMALHPTTTKGSGVAVRCVFLGRFPWRKVDAKEWAIYGIKNPMKQFWAELMCAALSCLFNDIFYRRSVSSCLSPCYLFICGAVIPCFFL